MKEVSYGIIPLQSTANGWNVLVVHHQTGFWGFPKGHAIEGESPRETASRELLEETGLTIEQFLFDEPLEEKYRFVRKGQIIDKTVIYFIAAVAGVLNIQPEEVKEARWVPLNEAVKLLTYLESQAIAVKVQKNIISKN